MIKPRSFDGLSFGRLSGYEVASRDFNLKNIIPDTLRPKFKQSYLDDESDGEEENKVLDILDEDEDSIVRRDVSAVYQENLGMPVNQDGRVVYNANLVILEENNENSMSRSASSSNNLDGDRDRRVDSGH